MAQSKVVLANSRLYYKCKVIKEATSVWDWGLMDTGQGWRDGGVVRAGKGKNESCEV